VGLLIFIAIVAAVVWFIYRGMQRQNARFGDAASVARVPYAPRSEARALTASSEPIDSFPLFVNLQQNYHGEHDKIVQTLNDVADMLKREVDARTFPDETGTNAKPVDHETYRDIIRQQSNRLATILQDAEGSFEQASSPGGTPEMLRQAYAAFLGQLLATARTFGSTRAPRTYAQTQAAYREFLKEFYGQIALWPETLREASKNVTGNWCSVVLSAKYDVGPMQHSIQTESAY